jgi:hypothetical protein
MITTSSKYLIGLSTAAVVGFSVYAIATGWGAMGSIGLMSAIVALGFLVGIMQFVRDGEVSAQDSAAVATCGAAQPAPGASAWPAVFGVGLGIVAVGSVTLPAIFMLGVVVILAAGAEWLVQAWAERASADSRFNALVRARTAYPLELPIAASLLLGVIVYGFSRLMLAVSKDAGTLLFALFGAIILVFGFVIARRSNLSKGVVGAICAVGLVAMAAGGVATALTGERSQLTEAAEEDHFGIEYRTCDAEAHDWDKKAAQTVGGKANIAATVRLTDEGLHAEQVGVPGKLSSVTLQRSNPSSIIFYNETSEDRRLNLELEQVAIEGTDAFEQRVVCTALVKEGGAQMTTVVIGLPSASSETPFRMVVPGVEGTEIEIVVP